MNRYVAKSAGKTEEWPLWYVSDTQQGGLNVTPSLLSILFEPTHAMLVSRLVAERLAQLFNRAA